MEIPPAYALSEYSSTGAGLKNRAHPLAFSIAAPLFSKIKQDFAGKLGSEIRLIKFLDVPCVSTLHLAGYEPAWYAFIMRFRKDQAPRRLTREIFVQQLPDEGLPDVDIPGSTKLLHEEALFSNPEKALPHVYPVGAYHNMNAGKHFTMAQSFYSSVIKVLVWAFEDESPHLEVYIQTIVTVAERWLSLEVLSSDQNSE